MLGATPKKLIIVGNKNTDVYCEYLSMLVSEINTEKNPVGMSSLVDTAIWTDEVYSDNRAHTSSRQKILFIGNDGCAKNIIRNINFDKEDAELYGIYFGWLGNKAVIYTDDTLIKNKALYTEKFYGKYKEMCERFNYKIEKVVENQPVKKEEVVKSIAVDLFLPGTLLVTTMVTGVKRGRKGAENRKTIYDQMYRYAILKFYLDYFETFMR